MFREASDGGLSYQKHRSENTCTREDPVRSVLSYQSRRELVQQMAPRYQEASRTRKIVTLDEFVAITGYARKYAIHLLNHPKEPKSESQQERLPHYGPKIQQALLLAWKAANQICAKRLIPFLPTLVEALERHGHLHLTEECRNQLLAMSATTADRLLRSSRQQGPRGVSTTRAGTLLKNQIPIRTFQEWNETQPGFLEAERARSLWHTNRGRICLHADPHGRRHGMDRMPPTPVSQSRDGVSGHPTGSNALSFPDSGS
jgi:hypothetical protein